MALTSYWKKAGDTPPVEWAVNIINRFQEKTADLHEVLGQEASARRDYNALVTSLTKSTSPENFTVAAELAEATGYYGVVGEALIFSRWDSSNRVDVPVVRPIEVLVELAESASFAERAEADYSQEWGGSRSAYKTLAWHPSLVEERPDVALWAQAVYEMWDDEAPYNREELINENEVDSFLLEKFVDHELTLSPIQFAFYLKSIGYLQDTAVVSNDWEALKLHNRALTDDDWLVAVAEFEANEHSTPGMLVELEDADRFRRPASKDQSKPGLF
jgi:hypothetical protein